MSAISGSSLNEILFLLWHTLVRLCVFAGFISGNCNFETGLCGYKNGSAQVGNFKRTQAIQGSLNRGPRIDSTFQNTTGKHGRRPLVESVYCVCGGGGGLFLFLFFTTYTTYSSEGEKTTEYTITKQQGE